MNLEERIEIISRKLIRDDRGWFLKTLTGTEKNLPSYTGEIYLTMGRPGQAKGGHYHLKATEWFTVIQGSALLQLEDIETKERIQIPVKFDDAKTVVVPTKVAHNFVNNSDSDFIVLAYTDFLYDPIDTIPYKF